MISCKHNHLKSNQLYIPCLFSLKRNSTCYVGKGQCSIRNHLNHIPQGHTSPQWRDERQNKSITQNTDSSHFLGIISFQSITSNFLKYSWVSYVILLFKMEYYETSKRHDFLLFGWLTDYSEVVSSLSGSVVSSWPQEWVQTFYYEAKTKSHVRNKICCPVTQM